MSLIQLSALGKWDSIRKGWPSPLLALRIYPELRECNPLLGHPRGGADLCRLIANARFQATNQLPLMARNYILNPRIG
jgi:hypothetical protein